MSDPKEPEEHPIEHAGVSAPLEGDAAQPWGAGARPPQGKQTALWAVVTMVAAVALAAIAWPVLDGLRPHEPDPALRALAGRIDRLESALKRIEAAQPVARLGENAEALAETRAAIAHLAARLAALEGEPARAAAEAAAHESRIQALGERIAALEQAGAQPGPLAGRLKELERRVAAGTDTAARERNEAALAQVSAENRRLTEALERISGRVGDLETRRAAAADAARARARLDSDLQAVAGRLEALEAETRRLVDAGFSRKGDALLLAIGQLRDTIASGRPFEAELRAVLGIAGEHGFIAEVAMPIAPHAASGIATPAHLAAGFPHLAAMAAQAALAPEAGGWIDRTLARLAQVVTVRRVGADVTGDTTLAVLARAEARLESGDLAGAEAALAPLAGKPAEVLADWRAAVVARIAARTAIARLDGETIARLSRAGGAEDSPRHGGVGGAGR